jgi:alcohol dehydrogenase
MAHTHKAWRLHAHNDLRYDDVDTPAPAPDGVVVRIEASMVLSYTGKVLSGSVPYSLPPLPFVPGTNAIARVIAVGENVTHICSGDRVFLSPHLRGDVPNPEPPQILIGLTATVTTPAALALQARWRNGVFAEIAHWPAACVTPLVGLSDKPATELIGLAKLIVPFGGLQRSGLRGGDTIIVNGATGYFGSGAVMLAVAMGAGRVVAVGRKIAALESLQAAFGPRIIAAAVTGDTTKDLTIIRDAAGGAADVALDLLGSANSTSTTLSTLRALKRGGRLVIMGSAEVPLEIFPRNAGKRLGNRR